MTMPLNINNGFEVKWVLGKLMPSYHVNANIVPCWIHGDCTARERLFVCALRRDIFTDNTWEWPDPVCDESFSTKNGLFVSFSQKSIKFIYSERGTRVYDVYKS